VPCSAKTSAVKWNRATFGSVDAGGFQIGDDGYLGGFEALRLIRFVFRDVVERWCSERMLAFVGEGNLSPLPGLGFLGGRNPALTRWAIVCRPSGPGAGISAGLVGWFRVVGGLRGELATFEP
jgi:hypothetical protein